MIIPIPVGMFTQQKSTSSDLILDTYSGASHAYSLRYLTSDYTGDVILVERSSDNATQGFTPNEITDGTLTAWVGTGNDGWVYTWYDQVGSLNLTEISDKRCVIVSSGSLITQNSLPAIYIAGDGANGVLRTGNGFTFPTEFTAILVNTANPSGSDVAGYGAWWAINQYGESNEKWSQGRNHNYLEYATGGVMFGAGHAVRATVRNSGNTGLAWTNGSSNGSASVTSDTESSLGILNIGGRSSQSDTESSEQYIQEFIFYPSDKSADISNISQNAKDYWV